MEILVDVFEVLAKITVFSLSANGILNLAVGFALSELISSLLYIQLMVYPMGFKVRYPVNFLKLASVFIWVAKFDVYPSEVINNSFLDFTETGPYSQGLATLLHDGTNFAQSAGSGLLIFLTMVGLIGIYALVSLAKYIYKHEILTKMKKSLSR